MLTAMNVRNNYYLNVFDVDSSLTLIRSVTDKMSFLLNLTFILVTATHEPLVVMMKKKLNLELSKHFPFVYLST